ncbi:MAG: peptidylprolyl isomerase [Clostridiales Family XIII bacterium]|nr:peptidylprolyl isomerase [Clostridiales Family XIII bacterium]
MSKTKRRQVLRKRLLTLAVVIAVLGGGLFAWQQITAGKTLAKVNGVPVKSGIVNGVSTYANYAMYAQYFGTGYFLEDMYAPGSGASSAATKEMEQLLADQKEIAANSALIDLCIPHELLKEHFADAGKQVPTDEERTQIEASVASTFSAVDTKKSLYDHGVRERHVKYYLEYQVYVSAFNDEIAESNPPTDEEIENYYNENIDTFTTPWSLDASHILIADTEHSEEGRQRIQEILDRVNEGEDFAALADEFSEDPGNVNEDGTGNGGALGSFGTGQMVAPFEEAALALQPGEVSGIVETDYGFHIIKLNSRTEEAVQPLDEVRETIISYVQQQHTQEALDALYEAADIVYLIDVYPETGKPPISQEELDAVRGTGGSEEEGGSSADAAGGSSEEAAGGSSEAVGGSSAEGGSSAAAPEGDGTEEAADAAGEGAEAEAAAPEGAEAPAEGEAAEEAAPAEDAGAAPEDGAEAAGEEPAPEG